MSLVSRKLNDFKEGQMGKLDELKELAHGDGRYQDVIVKGEKVVEGWRDCADRWEIISKYIKPNQLIMDIGSHFGYFAARIAENFSTSVVWSVEAGERRARVQKLMLEANGYKNVILTQHTIGLNDLVALVRSCEHIDTIMCLSTIHYFPPAEIRQILWLFGQLAPNLIIEFPSPNEIDVAEKSTVDLMADPMRMLGVAFDSVQKIGESTSPKDHSIKRSIYLAQNYNTRRDHCTSYLGSITGRLHSVEYSNAAWKIDDKEPPHIGINLAHTKRFNMIYPEVDIVLSQTTDRYLALIAERDGNVTDIHPRNVILTSRGPIPIDFEELIGCPIYNLSWEDYRGRVLALTKEKLLPSLTRRYHTESVAAMLNFQKVIEDTK